MFASHLAVVFANDNLSIGNGGNVLWFTDHMEASPVMAKHNAHTQTNPHTYNIFSTE